jgi:hypothetical protein
MVHQVKAQKPKARAALLLVAALLLAVSCSKKDNPLLLDTNLPLGTGAGNLPYVTGVAPQNRYQLMDDDPHTAGIQATVEVTFSDYMDEASVISSVSVLNTTTGEAVAGLSTSYNADARKLFVRHTDWTRSVAYLLVLATGGAKNRWNVPLDGNRNGIAAGAPYDDALSTFYTEGSSPDSCVSTAPPSVTGITPDTVRITETLPGITVQFSAKMDTTTLVSDNFKLFSETGSSVQLDRTGFTPWSVSFTPRSPLRFGDMYTITVVGAGVRADALKNTPQYLLLLDGDYDGPDQNEPDFKSYFLCDTVWAPTVSVTSIGNGMRFDFTELMDESTLGAQNVRTFDAGGYVPGTMVYSRNAPGNSTRIDYYFSRPTQGGHRAFVSRLVESTADRMLDGRPSTPYGIGIGGEPWDDFWGQ